MVQFIIVSGYFLRDEDALRVFDAAWIHVKMNTQKRLPIHQTCVWSREYDREKYVSMATAATPPTKWNGCM